VPKLSARVEDGKMSSHEELEYLMCESTLFHV
jgi:hypothetical protein